jgi:3-(3-hydroxy-phenyl)propionate hydroxylase
MSALKNDTHHPYRLQCEQFKLVGWVYPELRKIPGVELLMSHEVTRVTQGEDEVVVEANGKTFKGDYLIAGDGGRSFVRKALDIEFDGFTYPEHFLVAGTRYDFKAHMDICSVNYTADPDNWYVLLEIPDMWRIVAPVDPNVEPDEAMQEAYLQNCLQNLLPRPDPYEIVVKAIYRVSQRVAATYRKNRAFLAGDAAHINNPLGGLGLNGGVHDAVNLTERLARVWHGEAPESELDGYEPQRKPEAVNAILGQTGRNKKLMEERDPVVRAKNLDEWRALGASKERTYTHLLETSMIASLRRSGMLQ